MKIKIICYVNKIYWYGGMSDGGLSSMVIRKLHLSVVTFGMTNLFYSAIYDAILNMIRSGFFLQS